MLVRGQDVQNYREPLRFHFKPSAVLRLFLAASLLGWGLALREFSYLQDRVPIRENGIGYSVRSTELEIWWAPVLAGLGVLFLLLPRRLMATPVARALSLLVSGVMVGTAIVLTCWVAPIQAYREAVLFDRVSELNVAITAYMFALPGFIALTSVVVIVARTGLVSTARSLRIMAWVGSLGVVAGAAGAGLGQWLSGGTLRGSLTCVGLGALAVVVSAPLVAWWHDALFLNTQLVLGAVVIGISLVIMLPGLVLLALCLLGSGDVSDYACPASFMALGLAEATFLYGWVLNTRGAAARRVGEPFSF